MLGYQPSRSIAERAEGSPVQGVPPGARALDPLDQGVVPVTRPPVHDQSVLVEDTGKEVGGRGVVLAELLSGVQLVDARIVAVQLDDRAPGVHERFHSLDGAGTGDHLRADPLSLERLLDEAIEVGSQDHPDLSPCDQSGDGSVCSTRDLDALLTLFGGGLEEASEDCPSCRRGAGKSGEETGITERLPVAVLRPPLFRIEVGRVAFTRGGRGLGHESFDHPPPGWDTGAGGGARSEEQCVHPWLGVDGGCCADPRVKRSNHSSVARVGRHRCTVEG